MPALLTGLLEGPGFTVILAPLGDDGRGGGLVAGLRPDRGLPALCPDGHIDTVAVGGTPWRSDPQGSDVADGMLHGSGACDMKGVMAAMAVCADAMAGPVRDGGADLCPHLCGGEETGCRGSFSVASRPELLRGVGAVVVGGARRPPPAASSPATGAPCGSAAAPRASRFMSPCRKEASMPSTALPGTPIMILGPGDPAMCHRTVERCPVADIERACAMYRELGRGLVGRAGRS